MKIEKRPIRVVIVDDHAGVRRGIRAILEKNMDIIVAGEASSGSEAIKLVQQTQPDILLLDVEMPVMRGDEVARHVKQMKGLTRILAISSYNDWPTIRSMQQSGAIGYLVKDDLPGTLVSAVHQAAGADPGWIGLRQSPGMEASFKSPTLTQREYRLMRLMIAGHSLDEVAEELNIAGRLVQAYLEMLLSKFEVNTIAELVEAARRKGFAD